MGQVLGHLDGHGFCIGLGIVREVHSDRVEVLTAVSDVPIVRSQVGDFHLDPEELGVEVVLDAALQD